MEDFSLNDPASLDTSPMSSRYYAPNAGRVHLSGLFAARDDAERAVAALEGLGVDRAHISVILRDEGGTTEFASLTDTAPARTLAGEEAGRGSIIGGTVGAVIGALVAAGTTIVLPGIGLILGPIAGALAGAGAGGIGGGVIGALVGAGIPAETAATYQSGLLAGGVVVIADVPAALQADAQAILGGTVHD